MQQYSSILMIVAMIGVMYFLLIRPQQQQRKKHEEMVASLKRGDEVVLQGGMYGKIVRVQDDILEIEIAPDTVIRQAKSMILSLSAKPAPQAAKKAAAKSATAKASTSKTPAKKRAAPKKDA